MSAAVAALVGVVVGALLNYGLSRAIERRRDQRELRGACRLLYTDLFDANLALHVALHQEKWPPDVDAVVGADFRFCTSRWEEVRIQLARLIPDSWDFHTVFSAFAFMEEENKRLDAATAEYSEPFLRKMKDNLVEPSLGLVHDQTLDRRTRVRRWWNTGPKQRWMRWREKRPG
jgi:hypothetical protein